MLRVARPTKWYLLFWRGAENAREGIAFGVGPLGQPLEVDVDVSALGQYAGADVVEALAGTDDENFSEVMELQRFVRLQNNAPLAERCAAEVEFYRSRPGARVGVMSHEGSVTWTV
jgi:hypothetical protein